jgi:hypothetical protein
VVHIMRLSRLEDLERKGVKAVGYSAACQSAGTAKEHDLLEIVDSEFKRLACEFPDLKARPSHTVENPKSIAVVRFDAWPAWANAIAAMRNGNDAGVGDTIHRLLGTAGTIFKSVLKSVGAPCACDVRRADWNAMYNYSGLRDWKSNA